MTAESQSLQKQLYGIAIFEEEIVLSDFTETAERRHIVSPEQLMDFFRTEITFRPFPGLIWMKTDGNGEKYLLTFPAGKRTILYRKSGKGKLIDYNMFLPAIAVEASINGPERKISNIAMWGFCGKTLTPETILYELPLPNLSGSSLCLGSTEKAVTSDIRGAIERTIFDTPFNHHNHLVGKERIPFHDYVRKYKGRCRVSTLKRIATGRQILGGR